MPDINLIVNRQINRWNQERKQFEHRKKLDDSAKAPAKQLPVVTVSRERGCRGQEFSRLLAHELHYGVFDKQIVDYIAKHMGVRSEIIESLDEHDRSTMEMWVEGIIRQQEIDHDDYFRALCEVIKTVSMQGSVVILGRGANYLLQDTKAFHIRLVAPFDTRVQNLCQYKDLDEESAKKEIKNVDHERAQFVRRYFAKDINEPYFYDITLNLQNFTLDAAVKTVFAALRAKGWSLEETGGDKRAKTRGTP